MAIKAKGLISKRKEELKVIPSGYAYWRDRYVTNGKPGLKNYGFEHDKEIAVQFIEWIILGKLPKTDQIREQKKYRIKKKDRVYILSNELIRLREQAGLSLLDLELRTDISRAYICGYEKKKLKADITTIKILADFFKVECKTLIEKKVEYE